MTKLITKLFFKKGADPKDPAARAKYGSVCGIIGIITNFLLSVTKLLIGLLTFSVAIVADALNNLSDAGASAISLVSFKLSSKPADREHPFGHARIEYIASMIVSFLILLVGVETLLDAVKIILGISEAKETDFSTVSLTILGLSILVKLGLSFFQRAIGKEIDSGVLIASSQDSLFDCISTTAVLISSIIVDQTDILIIDAIVGIGVSMLILVAGIKILNETKNSLLGEAPIEETVNDIKAIIAKYPEIIGTHDLIVHNYGPNHYIASLHAEVDGNEDIYHLHDTIDNVEKDIGTSLGIMCTIHLDPIVTNDERTNELLTLTKGAVKAVNESIGIHDFRVVEGTTHTNLIFDIEVPFEVTDKLDVVVEKIKKSVSMVNENFYCVITVDRC